jgi:hypothetical protein
LNSPFSSLTALAGILLALYYAAFLRPFSHRVDALDHTLTNVWHALIQTNTTFPACTGINLTNAADRLATFQTSLTNLDTVTRATLARLDLPPEIRARIAEPFQLIDFQNERARIAEALTRLASDNGITFDPAVLNGLPEYSADLVDPRLLWPRLHACQQLLLTAIRAKPVTIRALSQLPTRQHRAPNPGQPDLEELPMRIDIAGHADALVLFLSALPLRGSELPTLGLPDPPTNKPPFFIDRILTRKHSPERPYDAFLELTLSAWVLPDRIP